MPTLPSCAVNLSRTKSTPNMWRQRLARKPVRLTFCCKASGQNSIIIQHGANFEVTPADVQRATDLIQSADFVVAEFETPVDATAEPSKLPKLLEDDHLKPSAGTEGFASSFAEKCGSHRTERNRKRADHRHSGGR